MLKKEIVKQPDAIEKYFCEPFSKLHTHPMNKELSELLITLLLGKGEIKIPDKKLPFVIQILKKRIDVIFTYSIKDIKLLLFLGQLAETPGMIVMYATYLQWVSKKRGIKEFTLQNFCDIFPMGFPSEEDLHKLWNNTKVDIPGMDNLVDHTSALQSIL